MVEHLDWAYSIARSVLRGLPTWFSADDLAGPAELGLIQAASRYNPESGVPFRAYAGSRVYGACMSSIRRREYRERAHFSLDSERAPDFVSPNPTPEALVIGQDGCKVWAHVWRLPDRHRAVIQGMYGEGRTLVEMAAACGIGESRLSQIHREALDMLRQVVADLR